jgi:4-amino-4-deoxy-L-arabinose transferase-like glycosyltransferase
MNDEGTSSIVTPPSRPASARHGWSTARAFWVAAIAALLISFAGVFDHALWTPDEPRDAEIGREMLVSGNYVVPTLAQAPFLEKPPLAWWVMTGLYKLFGVSDGVARMSSALAGLLTLLLVFDLVRRIADPFAALMATLATACLSGFYYEYHRAIVDPWLSLFVMVGYWAYVCAMLPHNSTDGRDGRYGNDGTDLSSNQHSAIRTPQSALHNPSPCPWAILILYLAGGLSFLAKGPVGPGLIAGPIIVSILWNRQWNFFRSWMHVPAALIFLALCALWPWLLYRSGGKDLLNGFLLDSLFARFFPPATGHVKTGHHEAFWYYFANFPASIMPWLLAVPAICHWFWRKRLPQSWNRSALVFLAWIFPIGLLMLSAAGTKRGLYLLPLVAPFGAVAGAWLASIVKNEEPHAIDRGTVSFLLILCVLVAFAALLGAVGVEVGREYLPSAAEQMARRIPQGDLILFSLVGVLFLWLSFFASRLLQRGRARVAALVVWMAFGLALTGMPLVYRSLDRFKSLHPFTVGLVRLDAFSTGLITWKADEVTRAAVPYDTGLYLKNFTDADEIALYVEGHPDSKLVMLEQDVPSLPDSVGDRLRLIRQWYFSAHRVYGLYNFGAHRVVSPPGER